MKWSDGLLGIPRFFHKPSNLLSISYWKYILLHKCILMIRIQNSTSPPIEPSWRIHSMQMAVHNPWPLLVLFEQSGLCSKCRDHVPVGCLAPCCLEQKLPRMPLPLSIWRENMVLSAKFACHKTKTKQWTAGYLVTLNAFRCSYHSPSHTTHQQFWKIHLQQVLAS